MPKISFCRIDSPSEEPRADKPPIGTIDLRQHRIYVVCITMGEERRSNRHDAPLPLGTRYLMRVQTTTYVDSSSMMEGTS